MNEHDGRRVIKGFQLQEKRLSKLGLNFGEMRGDKSSGKEYTLKVFVGLLFFCEDLPYFRL